MSSWSASSRRRACERGRPIPQGKPLVWAFEFAPRRQRRPLDVRPPLDVVRPQSTGRVRRARRIGRLESLLPCRRRLAIVSLSQVDREHVRRPSSTDRPSRGRPSWALPSGRPSAVRRLAECIMRPFRPQGRMEIAISGLRQVWARWECQGGLGRGDQVRRAARASLTSDGILCDAAGERARPRR